MIQIHVTCEVPGCTESEAVKDIPEGFDFSTITDRLSDDRFHFVVDTGWINGPKGWTLGADDIMRCPNHSNPKGKAS